MVNRRACDRCFKFKQKCVFQNRTEDCVECELSASTCSTSRLQLRQGRRPKAKPLGPSGNFQVWDVKAAADASIKCSGRKGPQASSPLPLENISEISNAWPNNGQRQELATVPKCSPSFQTSETSSPSIFRRPVPRPYDFQVTVELPFNPDSSPWVLDHFYHENQVFMLGRSFAPRFRAAIQHTYFCSPVLLHDIIVALGAALKWTHPGIPISRPHLLDEIDIAKGAVSLQRLRTARITGIQDAFAIVGLGQILAAFDLLTNCVGSVFILRYSLLSIKPWYDELSCHPSADPVTITSIFWDTVNCLVKRDVPVIKFVSRHAHVVDRMAGLCTTLLPIFYDLCVVGQALRQQVDSGSQINTGNLRKIEDNVREWAPDPPPNFDTSFSPEEMLRMEAQASMYRTAGLLICHRILNPIGTKDDIADLYAESIITDFTKYSAFVGPGSKLKNVNFPILVAAFEIPNVSQEIWKCIALSAAAPVCVAKISALIEHVWLARRHGTTNFLYDLIDTGPNFVVIP